MLYEQANREVLTLTSGDGRCEVIPTLGGSISAWTVGGQPMMRTAGSTSIAAGDPYGMASFPLVPYSNRIGNGRFEWDGREVALARNFFPEPHSIHGVGFEVPWTVRARAADRLVLGLVHRASAAWPWPFEAEQIISLADGVLTLVLRAVNLADRPVPLSFGHHPYFPREGASLQFNAQGVWLMSDDGLPSLLVKPFDKFDYGAMMPVSRGDIDHCFTGWDGAATIGWNHQPRALQISASAELSTAVVCIRSHLDGFCFEPVPHGIDALNRRKDSSMPVIEPGASFDSRIEFRAVRAAA
jgi:aldose 1-epimerase